jgi:hypothetical protein
MGKIRNRRPPPQNWTITPTLRGGKRGIRRMGRNRAAWVHHQPNLPHQNRVMQHRRQSNQHADGRLHRRGDPESHRVPLQQSEEKVNWDQRRNPEKRWECRRVWSQTAESVSEQIGRGIRGKQLADHGKLVQENSGDEIIVVTEKVTIRQRNSE